MTPLNLPDFVDGHDVGVFQLRGGLRFVAEPFHLGGGRKLASENELERN